MAGLGRTSAREALCALALVVINTILAAPLFQVEYSAYTGSNEGSFIAIARVMAEHPGEWRWWPFWAGGMPFENAYLPLLQWIVAVVSVVSGLSVARSFHIVTACFYVLGPLSLFGLSLGLSRRWLASFAVALAYSCLSLSTLLTPEIQADAGGPLALRRLQALVYFGAAPQVAALTLLPVTILCFQRALTREQAGWKIGAGVLAALVALTNAFGLVMLVIALLCLLLAYEPKPWWRGPLTIGAIGVVAFCWVSPWLSPSMIRAIRTNAMSAGGDFHYTWASWAAAAGSVGGFLLLVLLLRRTSAAPYVRFFSLLAYAPACFVVNWYAFGVAVVPQPSRYHLDLDMTLTAAVILGAAAAADRLSKGARAALAVSALALLAALTIPGAQYARQLIRSTDPQQLSEYKIAAWLNEHRPGERAFITGSSSFLYNVFTDNPQLHGAHEQHIPNYFIRVAAFIIYTGMNAGERDVEYSVFWLKAFGARAISVSGPRSTEFVKPFANPNKFEGVLPLLWRDRDDSIYGVPGRSSSLAHVMPAQAIPAQTPAHGLDIAPVEAYVAALDDPRYPLALFSWKGMSDAEIHATVQEGEVVAVQISYASGWEAEAAGRRQRVRGDAIGQMVIEPDCRGPCTITLHYTGGPEALTTRCLSLAATLGTLAFAWSRKRRADA